MKKVSLYLVGLVSIICLLGCSNIGQASRNIHVEIAPVKMDRNAIVTMVSDDGHFDTGVNLNELAQKHDLRMTIAGIVEWVEPYLDTWKEIESNGYLEMISHSWSHPKMSEENNYSEIELRHQITDSIEYFKENFFTDQIAFICPENTMSQLGYDILRENEIHAIRQGCRGENNLSPMEGTWASNWYCLHTFGIGDTETTEWRNSVIDDAIRNRTWVIEMWHNVYKEGQTIGYQGISYDMADEHLEYIAQKSKDGDVWVASLVDATKYIKEKQHSYVEAVQEGDRIQVNLTMDTEILPEEIFNYPLTIKIPLPEKWSSTGLYSEDDSLKVCVEEKNDVKYILFEMIPNGAPVVIKNK